jgi:hypothetical protein
MFRVSVRNASLTPPWGITDSREEDAVAAAERYGQFLGKEVVITET